MRKAVVKIGLDKAPALQSVRGFFMLGAHTKNNRLKIFYKFFRKYFFKRKTPRYFVAKRSEPKAKCSISPRNNAKRSRKEMNSEIKREMTAVELAASRGNTVDLFRIKWAKFRREGNPLFADEFDRNAILSIEQIAMLTATKSGRATTNKKHEIRSVKPIVPVGSQHTARPNEGGPETGSEAVKLEREKAIAAANWAFIKRAHKERLAKKSEVVKRDWAAIGALALVFVMATVISGANTFKVSGQLSNSWLISKGLMLMVSFTPILFIIAKMEIWGVIVAVCIVAFEGFCNTAATYLSLMGGMVYVWGAPRGDCSPFLQNVVELTASGHKQTAVGISICLALLVSSVQLVSFWGLKKRF